jgi:hypothetical protein
MAHHDAPAHAHASADDQYLETPAGAGYEHTDANVWLIVKFLGWLMVSALVIHVGLGFFYQMLIERAIEVGEQPYPLAVAQDQRLPPTPRLQQFPRNELFDFRLGEEDLLRGYGWMNKNAGTVHIPIDEAMRLTVERGLPSRTLDAVPPAEPGLMPSDASSGRTLERRRQ